MIRYFDSSVKKKDLFDTVIFSNWGFYFCLFFFVIPNQTKSMLLSTSASIFIPYLF